MDFEAKGLELPGAVAGLQLYVGKEHAIAAEAAFPAKVFGTAGGRRRRFQVFVSVS